MIERSTSWWEWTESDSAVHVALKGKWQLSFATRISEALKRAALPQGSQVEVSGAGLTGIDTTGALLLSELVERISKTSAVTFRDFKPRHLNVLNLVQEARDGAAPVKKPRFLSLLQRIGKNVITNLNELREIIAFLGQMLVSLVAVILHPRRIRFKELFVQLELGCVDAIPVLSLVMLLIGIVLAFLFGDQIEQYGANIFIVDSVTFAMVRELAPLIVAVIVAGRSGSAYTAQIGSMKINEEIDAMRTLGLSPMEILVLPRVLALVIAMPLLVFIGDVVGICGGIIIAEVQLDIPLYTFLERLREIDPRKSFYVGLIKAPVFAIFVALIGCRKGLTVERNARSVGLNTTATVVQSIVAVILLDAFFAVLFMDYGI